MADSGIDPLAQPMFIKPIRIEFITEMAIDIIHNHEKEKEKQVHTMHGQGKQEHHKNTGFYHCLQRVKRIGGPRRRVGGLVVHQVKGVEQTLMVHEAVRPVKVSIVYNEQQRKGQEEIPPTVLFNIGIKGSMLPDRGYL